MITLWSWKISIQTKLILPLEVFDENVRICDEGLRKVCDNTTIGQGEEVCRTHYETTCETRLAMTVGAFKVQGA